MLEFNAARFISLCQAVQTASMAILTFDQGKNRVLSPAEREKPRWWIPYSRKLADAQAGLAGSYHDGRASLATMLGNAFSGLSDDLSALNLPISAVAVDRLRHMLTASQSPGRHDLDELSARIRDELASQTFIQIDPRHALYYSLDRAPFGDDVADRMPMASFDIIDAGRCIALGQGTAAVFHLMRVMEVGLKTLAASLQIEYKPSWDSYLKCINAQIEQRRADKSPAWLKDEPFYRDLVGDLTSVKVAWRNPTVHVIQRYSAEEAEEIFRTVRTFTRRLASYLTAYSESEEEIFS